MVGFKRGFGLAGSSDKSNGNGTFDQFCCITGAEFTHKTVAVVFDGSLGPIKFLCCFFIRVAANN